MRKLLALLFLAILFCGKRGDPRPPVPVIPQATSDLVVAQRAGQVILSWSYPSLTTAGRSLAEIERIVVYRYVEELPVPAGGRDANLMVPGDIDPSVPQAVALFSKVPTIPQAQFAKLSSEVESIDKAKLAAATAGAKLFYADNPPFQSVDGRPVRVTYALVTSGKSAKSEFSNLATLVPLPVAAPPRDVTAAASAEGVKLTWTAPTTSVTQAAPIIAGYNIYRVAPGEPIPDFAQPLNTGIVTATSFTDVPSYGEHEYRVTAVGHAGPPLLQSEMSLPVKATFRDLIAPPAPSSLTPLIETKAVRLIWSAVDAADLAGYKIYRSEGVGHGNEIRDIGTIPIDGGRILTSTDFVDARVDLGIAYRYAVTAVDKTGNESAQVWNGSGSRAEDSVNAARWVSLAVIVAVAAFLRFDALGDPSYWLDEILHQQLTSRAAAQQWWRWITALHDEHGSLYYLTQLATRLFGSSEAAGRSAAALLGVATIPLLWFVPQSGRAAAVLLAVSPLHVYYSREARGYALLMFLTAALVLVMLRARSLAALCGVLAAMLYTAAVAAPAVASALLVAVLCALRTRERWYWRAAAACAATLFLFRVVYAARPVEDAAWPGFPGLSADFFDLLLRTFTVSALGSSVGGRVAVSMLVFAIVGAVVMARRQPTEAIVLVGMTVFPLITTIASLRLFDHFFAARYVTPALIGFVLLAAAGISAMVRWEAAAMLVAAVIASQTWAASRHDSFQKLDWRRIAQAIWNHSRPGDLVIAAEPWSEVSLRYYLDRLPPRVKLVHIFAADVADVQRQMHRASWLVTAGFTANSESRNWMCRHPLVLASPLENFRLHFAAPQVAGNATWFHGEGWGDPEHTFRWATARRATISVPRWSARDEVIRMRVLPVASGQTMRVSLNGHPIGEVALDHDWTEQSFTAPARVWVEGVNTLVFELAFVRIPGANDQRTLAAAFENITIGGPLVRLSSLIDAKTAWRNTTTNFPPERLDREAVVPLIARLGFHPETVWPLLERGEVRLENLSETVAWGPDCQDDRAFLQKAFAALLNRAPAPHEQRELLALPRARIPGRMVKWPEFREAISTSPKG